MKPITLFIILLLGLAGSLRAEYNLKARLDKTRVSINETIKLTIILTDPPIPSPTPAFFKLARGMKITDGKTSRAYRPNPDSGATEKNYIWEYEIKPLWTGRFELGPFSVCFYGDDTRTYPALVFDVVKAKPPLPELEVSVSPLRKTYYQGEVINAVITTVKRGPAIENVVFEPMDTSVFNVLQAREYFEDSNTHKKELWLMTPPPGMYRFPVIQGRYNKKIPRTGAAELAPGSAGMAPGPAGFGSALSYAYIMKEFKKSGGSLRIISLPEKNRPDIFYDQVGSYGIELKRVPAAAAVNQPMAIEVIITGTGNLTKLKTIEIEPRSSFKIFSPPRVIRDTLDEKVFEAVVIPLAAGEQTFPYFYIDYFDTIKKDYRKLKNRGIPIYIR